jgi:alpha-N-arabinofuranosidase
VTPAAAGEAAGLALLHSDAYHIRLEITGTDDRVARLICRREGVDALAAQVPVAPGPVRLGVEARIQEYAFQVAGQTVATIDGRLLSGTVAGGFFGALVGMYATSAGRPSDTVADFDWFEYAPGAG